MKKFILFTLTVLGTLLAAHAEIGSGVIMDGSGSNVVTRGTSRVLTLNRLNSGEHFGTATRTNLAYYATNNVVAVPATSCILVSGTAATSAATNVYFFDRSPDKLAWSYWTNVTVTTAAGETRKATELPGLGDYSYVRLTSVSNLSVVFGVSNYVALHWK